MPPKNSGGSTKFPGGHKVIHRTAQTAFVRVVTPRIFGKEISKTVKCFFLKNTNVQRFFFSHNEEEGS